MIQYLNLILKSKNLYENKINNQINLFQIDEEDDDDIR